MESWQSAFDTLEHTYNQITNHRIGSYSRNCREIVMGQHLSKAPMHTTWLVSPYPSFDEVGAQTLVLRMSADAVEEGCHWTRILADGSWSPVLTSEPSLSIRSRAVVRRSQPTRGASQTKAYVGFTNWGGNAIKVAGHVTLEDLRYHSPLRVGVNKASRCTVAPGHALRR